MKELVVILFIAGVVFRLARPIALRFTNEVDFARRRNVWVALTVVAFMTSNFWIFALFAVPTYIWMGRKDSNPIAAYLLSMHVVAPVLVDIPAPGIQVFGLDNYRLLAFCILIPTALRARRSIGSAGNSRMTDWLLLAYGAVQVVLFVPPDLPNHVILQDSATNLLRRVFLFLIDVFVLYYAITRSCNDQRKLIDAEAAFCLSSAIMALVATFEHFKGWLLYTQLAHSWNPEDGNYLMAWLLRGDTWLRAQASGGHSLSLGVMLATSFGFWLFLRMRVPTQIARFAPGIIFWLGMLAANSRGAWIGAVLIYLGYSALKPRAVSRMFKAAFMIGIVLGLVSMSPLGDSLIKSLPFTGGAPDANVIYRQRLLERSLELLQAHPFFGDQLAIQEMEDLRQGQGIIDIVNTYVGVALFSGWVGLGLFVSFILSATFRAYRAAVRTMPTDSERALLGFNIVACAIGIMLMIADCSLILGVEKIFYVVISFATAYARQTSQMTAPHPSLDAPQPTDVEANQKIAQRTARHESA